MAKNKNNSFKSGTSSSSKNSTSGSSKSSSMGSSSAGGSMKDTHAQVPSKGPSRSGPGGE